jgi:putative oligomerization/nucleic acid binding protein
VFGDNHRLREQLQKDGKRADAEVLELKERAWATKRAGEPGLYASFHLKLRVSPLGEPAFDVEITDQWRDAGAPRIGMKVPVLYDPGHQSKVALDKSPGRYSLIQPRDLAGSTPSPFDDPDLAALTELDEALGETPAAPSESRLDRLQQAADLHDRGVLNDDEFAAEKAKILAES